MKKKMMGSGTGIKPMACRGSNPILSNVNRRKKDE